MAINKFIICLDYETSQEVNSFTNHVKSLGYGWWHRTSNSWVITSNYPLTGQQLRDIVLIYFPNRRTLVIDLQTKNWCGWGIKEDFDWFDQSW